MKQLVLSILLIVFVNSLSSQTLTNFRVSNFNLDSDTIVIDNLSIIPNTSNVYDIEGNPISDTLYKIDLVKALFIPSQHLKKKSSAIKISYRVFPYYFAKKYYHKDISIISSSSEKAPLYSFKQEEGYFFEKDKINKRGSISRGITFGNNQDVVVNSNLNLQLSGKLNDNLEILAAISDNNIPIQPDGNSQQIQEFDKVFISIFNDKTNLTVGDFEVKKPVGNFMNLYKKAQGGIFTTEFDLKKKGQSLKTTVSGAVSKGKYNRMFFNGEEGNQGPYKLKGSNNEAYIIILSGTEKIYIDGKLLIRGEENDYIIDYNTAELKFTPNQPITKDKRITVEFEYSDKNYARFLLFNSSEFKTQKGNYWINAYSEQDSKNQPIQQELSDKQKQILSNAGDSLIMAIVPNIDSVEFQNDIVLYKMIDTLVNGIRYDSILVYSTNQDSAFYRAGFSNVGPNKGNYKQIQSSANGRVFEWIGPINGVPQGNFEPVILLATPKKKQMVALGGVTKLSATTKTSFELAFTNNDINTFSSKHASDNVGYALKLQLIQNIPVKDTNETKLNTSATYQLIDKYFDPIDNFRSVEFERDWNLTKNNIKENEHLLNFNLDFHKNKLGDTKYDFDMMSRENGYNATKNHISSILKKKGFTLSMNGSILNSNDNINTTSFLRQNILLSKNISNITIGVKEESENNQWRRIESDSLLGNSFTYNQWEVFVNNSDTSKTKVFANYINRKDLAPYENRFKKSTLGEDFNFGIHFMKNPNNNLKSKFTYRKLSIIDSTLATNEAENNITGRIEHNLVLLKGAFSTSTFYEIGSGLEVMQEFSYLEVAQGQGVYAWTDYNANNIKEIDEFEVSSFQDQANYIRIFTPTNEYVKTYMTQFSQLINFTPNRIWHNKNGIKKFSSKLSDQFAYRIDKKNSEDNFLKNSNPILNSLNDSSLISINTSLRNTISFNKTNPKYSLEYTIQDNKSKLLLLNGSDTRYHLLNGSKLRWSISKKVTFINDFNTGQKSYSSEYFRSKNYKINYNSNETSISIQPTLFIRISFIHKYSIKDNILSFEKAKEQNIGTELKYNILTKGNLSLNIKYIKFTYNSETNTPVAYAMLDGFMPGNNATWTILFQRSLSETLQINLSYNGRVSEDTETVHTGGVQLRAYF